MSMYKKYLEESYKEYHYRIKTIVPLESKHMDKIENVLRKYDLKDVSSPRRTPIQEHPLEFYNVQNKEVYIVDAVLGMPASSYVLREELKDILDTVLGSVVVRSDNDPIEMYSQNLTNEEEYETKLSTDSEYNKSEQIDAEPSFGDKYNEKFLSRIARARMKLETDVADEKAVFNKDHDGIKPHYGNAGDNSVETAPTGNFDDEKNPTKKVVKDGVR